MSTQKMLDKKMSSFFYLRDLIFELVPKIIFRNIIESDKTERVAHRINVQEFSSEPIVHKVFHKDFNYFINQLVDLAVKNSISQKDDVLYFLSVQYMYSKDCVLFREKIYSLVEWEFEDFLDFMW